MEGARVAGRQPFMPRKALASALAALRFAGQATDDMRGRFTAPTRGTRSLAKRATACSVPAQRALIREIAADAQPNDLAGISQKSGIKSQPVRP